MPSPNIHYLPYLSSSEHYFAALSSWEGCVWLDSGKHYSDDARYDILTAKPLRYIDSPSRKDVDEAIRELGVSALPPEIADLPFVGGLIGCVDYEALHNRFGLNRPDQASNMWGVYNWALIQDHDKQQCCLVTLSSCESDTTNTILQTLRNAKDYADERFKCSSFSHDMPREQYRQGFERIQNYIRNGDCYQINFTQRFSASFSGSTASAYLHLRKALSGPYSAYAAFPNKTILSLSPEQFVKVEEQQAQTQPIKGTIRRGLNEAEDEQLKSELTASEKNRAENLMIVDLLRNDFGKHCLPGSVRTPHLFSLKSYKNVHHLVSTVVGTLTEHTSHLDFFHDCFPGGSITGAPKKRAMEIIEELETHEREIYCGSIVYISANNKSDSSIAIRTVQISDGKAFCWGGGGIVADSQEAEEYEESLQKIRVLLNALSNTESS